MWVWIGLQQVRCLSFFFLEERINRLYVYMQVMYMLLLNSYHKGNQINVQYCSNILDALSFLFFFVSSEEDQSGVYDFFF